MSWLGGGRLSSPWGPGVSISCQFSNSAVTHLLAIVQITRDHLRHTLTSHTPTLPTHSFPRQVADRLQAAVDKALDQGYRTKDIWKEGTQLVKCSEMGEILLKNMAA